MSSSQTHARIEDYAMIGDRETAALVCRSGSIDWLCAPSFDSGACFAALLGTPAHGRWLIQPVEQEQVVIRREYVDNTLVLQTEFTTPTGAVVVTDFMRIRSKYPNLVRIVEGRRGIVPMKMELVIRFDYGSIVPWLERMKDSEGPGQAFRAIAGPDSVVVRSGVPVVNKGFLTSAQFDLHEGERIPFELTWRASYEDLPEAVDPFNSLRDTIDWWRNWSSQCTYKGDWQAEVMRSLITLKALTYAPTSGIVAAPTTSLPEHIGGVRNWDYRLCWLRDSTLTLLSLLQAGYREEADAWRQWLLRAVAGDPGSTRIMYGLSGERRIPELVLDWLPGYEGSRPVRTGNAAAQQFQLDVYGEVIDTLFQARKVNLDPEQRAWAVELALLKHVEDVWNQPDEGIWEVRSGRRHFTYSKIMAWVALTRGIASIEQYGVEGPVQRWRQLRDRVHAEVCEKGYDPQMKSFVQSYGSKDVDASLLLIPNVGFLPAQDSRVAGTVKAIESQLLHDGFVHRYDTKKVSDGLPPGEGVFLACTFWYASCLHMLGRTGEAREVFARLLDVRNDVGLLAEEYDPQARRQLGNFPQAFSHIGLVDTAMNLSSRKETPAHHRKHM